MLTCYMRDYQTVEQRENYDYNAHLYTFSSYNSIKDEINNNCPVILSLLANMKCYYWAAPEAETTFITGCFLHVYIFLKSPDDSRGFFVVF